MKFITSPRQMQRQALAMRGRGLKIVFVPTMGALHEGHLSLIRRARKLGDVVVASIYVNPTQFGPKEDFSRYPRRLQRDMELAKQAGANVVFAPTSLYEADASTFVEETQLSRGRCGDFRPGHFRGVATVVCKLFSIVQPHIAVFGQKDAQQCDVIERMTRDLFLPVKIVRAPIVRDKRGLALSSRNQYLSPQEYEIALRFPLALRKATEARGFSPRRVEERAMRLLEQAGLRADYATWANGFLCAAVRVGKTRLLDNVSYRSGKNK
ncbi:MAG: pantoate--beta-alanine ligase [bacterium]